jgi:hypothetical protein
LLDHIINTSASFKKQRFWGQIWFISCYIFCYEVANWQCLKGNCCLFVFAFLIFILFNFFSFILSWPAPGELVTCEIFFNCSLNYFFIDFTGNHFYINFICPSKLFFPDLCWTRHTIIESKEHVCFLFLHMLSYLRLLGLVSFCSMFLEKIICEQIVLSVEGSSLSLNSDLSSTPFIFYQRTQYCNWASCAQVVPPIGREY